MNADFRCVEDRLFTLDMPRASLPLFAANPGAFGVDRQRTLRLAAARLASVCVALNEYPFIRFRASHPNNGTLATLFREQLENHMRNDPKFW